MSVPSSRINSHTPHGPAAHHETTLSTAAIQRWPGLLSGGHYPILQVTNNVLIRLQSLQLRPALHRDTYIPILAVTTLRMSSCGAFCSGLIRDASGLEDLGAED